MIDASHVKVHPDTASAWGRDQAMGRTKGSSTPRYIWPWMHAMPVRFFITSGATVDYIVVVQLIEGFQAEYLPANQGYDTDAIILKAVDAGIMPVVPPKKNRKHLRE